MVKTGFKPEVNGFSFINSWTMKPEERTVMRQTLTASTSEATNTVGAPLGMLKQMVMPQIEGWIDNALPDYYGLCGGMAFSAADHFRAGKPLPYGRDPSVTPNSNDPTDTAVRNYLWERQLESLRPNASVLLSWMMMLHLPIPGAGPAWLRDRTREQLANLGGFLAHGPWPLCLIGTSTSPFNNHQVLAIGLDDKGDGTATISLYDSNGPGREQTIQIDTRGDQVEAVESLPSPERGPLRGFFCMHYSPEPPPDLSPGGRLAAPRPDQTLRK